MSLSFKDRFDLNMGHLMNYNSAPYEVDIKIVSADNCCNGCKKLSERLYTINEAVRLMPVPNKKCNQKVYRICRCRYIAIPKRDPQGRLIMKQ
jgi:hypothetical protein